MFLNQNSFNTVNSLAVAGTNQATAAAIAASNRGAVLKLTGGDATAGATLPTLTGEALAIVNGGSNTVKIYPATGGTINGGAANAAYSLAGNKNAILIPTAADTWYVVGG
jgi:hypothetical protein